MYMNCNFYQQSLLLILLFVQTELILSYGDTYYQIIDDYSFNFRNKNDYNKIYQNFNRRGDLTIFDDFITMAPYKNNTYGMLYTKGQIYSSDIELQIKFSINNVRGSGSAFVIWFFKDNLEGLEDGDVNSDFNSFVGFKPDYNGYAVMVFTPPKTAIDPKTYLYVQENDSTETKKETGFTKVALDNSCNEGFQGRTVKITMKLETSSKNMAINYNTREHLHYPCLGYAKVQKLDPPFRIGISSFNGIIEGQQFLDNVQLKKFTVFNLNEELKDRYAIKNSKFSNITKDQTIDLIDAYPDFINSQNNLNNPNFIKDLNNKFDSIISYLSDVKNNLESKENLENQNEIKKVENLFQTYKDYIIFIQNRFKELKDKLNALSNKIEKGVTEGELIKLNKNDNNNENKNNYIKNGLPISEMEFEIFFKEVDKLKKEWDNNKIKNALKDQLNIMLSEKVDEIVNTLKMTKGEHIQMAGKLNDKLRENSNYISEKIDTNYFAFCIVLALVIGNIFMLFWLYRRFKRYTKSIKSV